MKKLKGMKKNFSSLENKKLADLKSIEGGLLAGGSSYAIKCNFVNSEGCTDQDLYNDDGSYKKRAWLCVGDLT